MDSFGQLLEYQVFLDNLPGGVQQCLNDGFFTMLEVNQGFLDLFGYSREELQTNFQNRYLNMIHPEDRQKILEETANQLQRGKKVSYTYRALCKDGTYKWVQDNGQLVYGTGGPERFLCVMLDITEVKKAREELRLLLERHQIILDQATDIIFEWDALTDTVTCSPSWSSKFGYESIRSNIVREKSWKRLVHPDDIDRLLESAGPLRQGKDITHCSVELRIKNTQGSYIWCRIRLASQYDQDGGIIQAVGVITDIDAEKRLIDDLRHRAEHDALTGLYNRDEVEKQVERYLSQNPAECCALLMIDTDDFKLINDTQGHLFGDSVLSELAVEMRKLTRASDIVGRIGGDEFAIFLKNVASEEAVLNKATQFLEVFRKLFRKDEQLMRVTCSVGVAIYPDDGQDFQSLYYSADQALYQAKNKGKNQFVLYDGGKAPSEPSYSPLGTGIDSDTWLPGAPLDFVNYVFKTLYETEDMDRAIELILEIVGKRFAVSRAYIFENSKDGKYGSNTYEWCNEGIEPQIDNLQDFPYETLEGYADLFGENGIFYCTDISKLKPAQVALFTSQGICSTLQCCFVEDGKFAGFLGFDECTGNRLWTREEVGTLSLVSQIVATFLQKKRAIDRDRYTMLQLKTILDMQDAYIYVVDKSTYELLYLNKKTRELDPNARVGIPCYRMFFDREQPCETCPIRREEPGEFYNPKYKVWTQVHLSKLKWTPNEAWLLSCYDITKYKQSN